MLSVPGAVAVEALAPSDVDAGVAAHYGDPLREQRTAATQVALVDRGNRGVLTVTGPDRLTGTELLVLSPHGQVEHHAIVLDDGETTWLDVEPRTATALRDFLDK